MTDEIVTTTTVEIVARPGLEDVAEIDRIIGDRLDLTPFEFRRPWMRAFIAAYARSGDPSSAARAAQINYTHVFDVRKADPVFAAAWKEADSIAADLLEQVAIRRATTGEEKVTTRTTRKFTSVQTPNPDPRGEPINRQVLVEETVVEERVNVKSDAILMFLLKARRPEQFRERIDPGRVPDGAGGPVEVYRPVDLERARAIAELMVAEDREHADVDHEDASSNGSANGHAELGPGDPD